MAGGGDVEDVACSPGQAGRLQPRRYDGWFLVDPKEANYQLVHPLTKTLFLSHSHLRLCRHRTSSKEVRLAKVIDHTTPPTTHSHPPFNTPPTPSSEL